MGLDIYSLADPVFVKPRHQATDTDWDTLHFVDNDPAFADRADGRLPGLYRGDFHRHGGWAYSGYNRLREAICHAAFNVDPQVVWASPGAFDDHDFAGLVPLIHFSDCEGAIGPETSARIARALDRLAVEDDYTRRGVGTLLSCFRRAAATDGFAVWA